MPIVMPPPTTLPPPPGGLGQRLQEGLRYALERSFAAIADPLVEVIGTSVVDRANILASAGARFFTPSIEWARDQPGIPLALRELLFPPVVAGVALSPVAMLLGGLAVWAIQVSGLLNPISRLGAYQTEHLVRTGRVNPTDALNLIRQGVWERTQAQATLADQGYGEEYLSAFQALTRQYPDLTMMTQMMFRGHVGPDVVKSYLVAQGMEGADADRVLQILPVVPGIQDLITMAVREAFSPEIISKFGTHEDFPAEFGDRAAKQGLSTEYALAYWAAHWTLPSVSQGYEMLHRGVITQDELMTLLQTQDIMPFWRDKVLKVSYSPYTRVDIRRMYKAGVLDQAAVLRAYQDGGYDAEHAGKLTEWTIKDTTSGEKELAKGELISAYQKGVMDPGTVKASLTELGYTAETVGMLLAIADYKKVTVKRDPVKSLQRADLTRAYLDGLMQRGELETGLHELGYPADEATLILRMIDAEQGRRKSTGNRDLAKGEMETAYSKGIIDAGRFRSALGDMGYDGDEVDFILTLADWRLADHRQTEEIEVIRQMYLNRYITREQVIVKLGQSNLPDTQVQRMMYLWDIDYQKRLAAPTGAQLTSFAKAGIIDAARYATELGDLGYSPEHVGWFVAALKPPPAKPK